jgi:hypothetical protein
VASGVVQGVGFDFKPQYAKKKKREERERKGKKEGKK